jgi:DNA-3-methyladenine glycosylase
LDFITMTKNIPLPFEFYNRPVLEVARGLLGKRLVRRLDGGQRLAGVIIETEAYDGEKDLACHAKAGRTKRTQVMYGPSGRLYVYFTYGMHWLMNVVTSEIDYPAAVLLRAALPVEGLEVIASRRAGRKPAEWCSGPARLCQAFGVDGSLNGIGLLDTDWEMWIEEDRGVAEEQVLRGPRVGLNTVPEPWFSLPWRFRCCLEGEGE